MTFPRALITLDNNIECKHTDNGFLLGASCLCNNWHDVALRRHVSLWKHSTQHVPEGAKRQKVPENHSFGERHHDVTMSHSTVACSTVKAQLKSRSNHVLLLRKLIKIKIETCSPIEETMTCDFDTGGIFQHSRALQESLNNV